MPIYKPTAILDCLLINYNFAIIPILWAAGSTYQYHVHDQLGPLVKCDVLPDMWARCLERGIFTEFMRRQPKIVVSLCNCYKMR